MISEELLNKIKESYALGSDNESLSFRDENEQRNFWIFFKENANNYVISESSNASLINESNLSSRCFGNAQKICVNNSMIYCEGFYLVHGEHVFHAFNLNSDNTVEDYTVLSNPEVYGNGVIEYCGICIDENFICELNLEKLTEDQKNIPFLVLEYFRRHNSV